MAGKQRRNKSGYLWILAGLLFLGAALFLVLYNIWESDKAGEASHAAVVELAEEIAEFVEKTKGEDLGEPPVEREMPAMEINGYRYIGYLDVPVLGMRLPVMEEWDYDRLKIAPCRFYGNVYQDNLVIAGHNYQKHFSPLRWQGIGTEIDFTDVDGIVYHYEIADIEILKPDQVSELVKETDAWDMSLFTCTIGGQTRYVIRCRRTDKNREVLGK